MHTIHRIIASCLVMSTLMAGDLVLLLSGRDQQLRNRTTSSSAPYLHASLSLGALGQPESPTAHEEEEKKEVAAAPAPKKELKLRGAQALPQHVFGQSIYPTKNPQGKPIVSAATITRRAKTWASQDKSSK